MHHQAPSPTLPAESPNHTFQASLQSHCGLARRNRGRRRCRGGGRTWRLGLVLGLGVWALAVAPASVQAQRPLGIDVSDYQGTVTWTSVKAAGISFAWAKATEGTSVGQATFVNNENNGKAAGVYMGAYHYAHPELNSAGSEASYFWSVAGSYILADGKTLMPMLDIEGSAFNVGSSALSAWINAWCADVVQYAANAGVAIKPCIYVSACNACGFDSTVGQWNCDIADYNNEDPQTGTPWSTCTGCERWGSGVWNFWQYTSSQTISGISGNVDHDVFSGTASTLLSQMLATASSSSAIYYWDPQGTSGANPYTGSMSQTWENAKWSYVSTGLNPPTNWVEGKAACFGVHTGNGTPAYTVTINAGHVVAGFFDGALAPNSCDVTINGSGIIDLADGAQALDAHNSSDGSLAYLRINCIIAGGGQLVPEGNGQSFLHGANTFTGGTALGYSTVPFSGIVNFNNGSAFGSGTLTFTPYGNGGALVLEGSSAVTVPNDVSVSGATTNNIVANAAGLTFSGNWSMGAHQFSLGTGAAGDKVIISGAVSGSAGLRVYNSGTLVLSGVNTYSGATTIVSPATFTIDGAGQLGSGSYSGAIANGGALNYNSTASQTLSGVISGTGPVKDTGGGSLVLSGANTYGGGTTVSGGSVLSLNADSGLGAATAGLTLNGGCLKNNNSSPTITSSRTITLGANGGYVDAGWAPAHPVTLNSKLTGAGDLLIDLDGSPVVIANTGNNYTGDTIVGANGPGYYASGTKAWLKLGASGVIPNGAGYGNVIINSAYAGVLDLAGFSQTINGLSGDGTVDNSAGAGSLSVGNNDTSSTFSGVLQNSTGTLALGKVGSGTLTLSGASTYTGATTVSAGTLAFAAGGSLGATALSVASGATLANTTTSSAALGGSATLSSGAAASFTAVGGPSSAVGGFSVGGDLSLNNNTLTISVSGSGLALGSYRLLDCAGTVSGAANPAPVLMGTPLDGGYTAVIVTTPGSAGHVDLLVRESPAFSNLAASQAITYGVSGITLGGTLSAPGPLYPAMGETISVTINGNLQTTTVNDATGDFSLTYNPSSLPASASPYAISYGYAGSAMLQPASDNSTTLTVNTRPVVMTGTRAYNGTNDAAAAVLSVTNTVGSDVVTVASGTGTLAGAGPGWEAITDFGDLALGGASATNYTLSGASGQVLITLPGFAITSEAVDTSGTNFVLTFVSVPGLTYHVLSTNDASAARSLWPDAGPGAITATDTTTTVTIPMTGPFNFFDVKGQ